MGFGRTSFLFLCPIAVVAQPAAPTSLTQTQQEEFLRTAKVLSSTVLSEGVTGARRMQMEKEGFAHDAEFQTKDELIKSFTDRKRTELNFKDSYKFNIAAYELAKMLGISDMIPPSIERRIGGTSGAVTWWVDDVMMQEKKRMRDNIQPPSPQRWNQQVQIVRVFDQLIANTDRNLGNLLITKSWRVWMIDHTRSFRPDQELRAPGNLTHCDRGLLDRMRQLNKVALKAQLGRWITGVEIDALLARRDRIVAAFEASVKDKGEQAVLFDRPTRE